MRGGGGWSPRERGVRACGGGGGGGALLSDDGLDGGEFLLSSHGECTIPVVHECWLEKTEVVEMPRKPSPFAGGEAMGIPGDPLLDGVESGSSHGAFSLVAKFETAGK